MMHKESIQRYLILNHIVTVTASWKVFWETRPHNAFFHVVFTAFAQCQELSGPPAMTQG